jgi:hypothetical protein
MEGVPIMKEFREQFHQDTLEAWDAYMRALETSVNNLEKDVAEAAEMQDQCTAEWCEATEHVIDEINDALFMISEPRWSTKEDSNRIKKLKHRVRELYVKYKAAQA